jgi:hypothetical protein
MSCLYGQRAKRIKNLVGKNDDASAANARFGTLQAQVALMNLFEQSVLLRHSGHSLCFVCLGGARSERCDACCGFDSATRSQIEQFS